jgi:hypothetical protein
MVYDYLDEDPLIPTPHQLRLAARLSALWVAVSLASQLVLGHLPIDVPQVGVVGEMPIQFWE